MLLVLTVLVTIPLAVYAWRQKNEAEYQARQAELQRDEANRQRVIAENSLRDRLAALGTADKPLDELKRYNPSSAAAIETQIASARAEAQKEFADLTTALRAERDDALRRLASANRALAARGGAATESTGTTGGVGRNAPPPKSQDEADVEKLLRMYEAAYWAKDVEALRRVQVLSSAEAKAIRTEFSDVLQYRVTVDKADIRVSADGRSAAVTAEVHRIVTRGSRVSTITSLKIFTIERRRNGWIIVNVR